MRYLCLQRSQEPIASIDLTRGTAKNITKKCIHFGQQATARQVRDII